MLGRDAAPVHVGNREEEIPVRALTLPQRRLELHVDRLEPCLALVAHRADIDADAAARAVLDCDLERELLTFPLRQPRVARLECRRSAREQRRFVSLCADDRVRADHHAFRALDADLRVPHRHLRGEVALLPARRAGRKRAVARQRAHRQFVAAPGDDRREHFANKRRRFVRHRRAQLDIATDALRHFDFVQMRERLIHGVEVHLHDVFAFLAVSLANRILDRRDRLVVRQHAGDGKEADLHDRVDPSTHAARASHGARVDDEEAQPPVVNRALHPLGKPLPHSIRRERRVQQEGPVRRGALQHVEPLEKKRLVTADEIRLGDEIRRADRLRSESQV